MANGTETVLVTSANGRTGRAILGALAARGTRARAFIRAPRQADALMRLGAAECATGDLRDPTSLLAASAGCACVVHVGPPMHVEEVAMTQHVIVAAQQAGVSRFVYYSVLRPAMRGVHHHERKLDAERILVESGLAFTIVQPARYMQHLEAIWARVKADGEHAMPFGVESRFSVADLMDLAEASARVATEPGHTYATYELAGPQALSQRDMAAIIGERLGRPVVPRQVPLDELAATARRGGADEARVANMLAMNAHYDRYGFVGNPNVLGWLLQRAPTDFGSYVDRLIASA
jgi:uncharacterized protein YbjT (DUF2867 family)